MITFKNIVKSITLVAAVGFAGPAMAQQILEAKTTEQSINLDGDASDWANIGGVTVPLTGRGGVESVEIKTAIRGGMIYLLAVWPDSSEGIYHKPYKWNESSKSYKKGKEKEDRFAISLKMSGDFSANKLDGRAFEADVWHWKASRSNPGGVAHDKMWKVSTEPFEKAKKFKTKDGKQVYVARRSDAGDRLYKPVKYDAKQDATMPSYQVNKNAKGSIADVKAKGVWRDGKWYLELARKLDTGHPDDAVIPAAGNIEVAIAVFNAVGGKRHSVSETIVLKTGAAGS
jgi:hypothetical protein